MLKFDCSYTCDIQTHKKHLLKVHVWADISWRGKTNRIIFDGIMTAEGYINILRTAFIHTTCISRWSSFYAG